MMSRIRRITMRVRGLRLNRRRARTYHPKARHLKVDCYPLTPAPPLAELPDWPPRITRWVRVAFPQCDDTMLLPPGTAAMVQELMARDFVWGPR